MCLKLPESGKIILIKKILNKSAFVFSIIVLSLFLNACNSLQTLPFVAKRAMPAAQQIKPIEFIKVKLAQQETQALKAIVVKKPSLSPAEKQALIEDQNLWDIIPTRFQIPQQHHRSIAVQKRWFLKNPDYLLRVSKRAQPFLFFIVDEIEKRGLPAELALLPIVESAFQTYAYSHGRAAGIWQFIPSTGKYFGLKQNWWYDGRRDIYAATHAALDYLTQLNRRFDNDWLLALAAYNAGAGNVNKAIRKNKRLGKGISFWDLKLPKETKAYVPKLLALAQIIKANKEQPHDSIPLLKIDNRAFLQQVDVGKQIDLAVAADLAQISIDQLYQYNPAFNQWATHPQGPHKLFLPITQIQSFQQNLAQLDKNQLVQWTRYKIKNGDSLSTIAHRYQVTIQDLRQVNHLRNNSIRAGKFIFIPTASKNSKHYSQTANNRRNKILQKIHRSKRKVHVVKSGESFWTIARKNHISYKKLAKVNHLSPRDTLSIGQKLIIWHDSVYEKAARKSAQRNLSSRPTARKIEKKISYRVRKGDSLYVIAKRFKVTINKVVKWNRLNKKRYLKPGQKLTLYIDITQNS